MAVYATFTATEVGVGKSRPQATDADGSRLRFIARNQPASTAFNTATGTLRGTPKSEGRLAGREDPRHDGTYWRTLPPFAIRVGRRVERRRRSCAGVARKATDGHYFAPRYEDTPADVAMLCGQPGVKGMVWRRTWNEVEPSPRVFTGRRGRRHVHRDGGACATSAITRAGTPSQPARRTCVLAS